MYVFGRVCAGTLMFCMLRWFVNMSPTWDNICTSGCEGTDRAYMCGCDTFGPGKVCMCVRRCMHVSVWFFIYPCMAEIAEFEEARGRFVYVGWLNVHVHNLQRRHDHVGV